MSLAIALMLAAQPAAAPPSPAVADEIAVIGRKLKDWRGTWKLRKGQPVCKTTRSTGDKAVDAVACAAMTDCVAPHMPAVDAILAAGHPKDRRQQLIDAALAPVPACLKDRHEAGVAALADRRAGA